jgi:hypothetical protein
VLFSVERSNICVAGSNLGVLSIQDLLREVTFVLQEVTSECSPFKAKWRALSVSFFKPKPNFFFANPRGRGLST